jgi:hypothetical protein
MNSQLDWAFEKLQALRSEYLAAETQARELQIKQSQTRDQLLRLSGAMQILEEMVEHSAVFTDAAKVEARPS